MIVAGSYDAVFAMGERPPRFQAPASVTAGGFAELAVAGKAYQFAPISKRPAAFSYELMLRRAATGGARSPAEIRVLLADRGAWGVNQQGTDGAGTLAFVFMDAKGVQHVVLSREPIPPDVWTHVVAVWTGEGIGLYVNGQLQGYQPALGVLRSALTPAGRLGVGLSGGHAFEGAVAELRMWERALSTSEVRRAMQGSSGWAPVGPVREWSFSTDAGGPVGGGSMPTSLRPLS